MCNLTRVDPAPSVLSAVNTARTIALCMKMLLTTTGQCASATQCPAQINVGWVLNARMWKTHMNTVCPLTVVKCDFHYAGCEVQLVRKNMPTHLAESLATHISLLTTQTQVLAGRGGQDTLLSHLSLFALHNQQLTQLTMQQKESLEESLHKIQELEREKQNTSYYYWWVCKYSQKQVNARSRALQQTVNEDVEQQVAELRKTARSRQSIT